jgi:hypothetical protein
VTGHATPLPFGFPLVGDSEGERAREEGSGGGRAGGEAGGVASHRVRVWGLSGRFLAGEGEEADVGGGSLRSRDGLRIWAAQSESVSVACGQSGARIRRRDSDPEAEGSDRARGRRRRPMRHPN